MWWISLLPVLAPQKAQFLNLSAVYLTRFHRINSRCIHAAMTEDVSKAHDVLLQAVISAREKMTEVVRKDLLFRHVRRLT